MGILNVKFAANNVFRHDLTFNNPLQIRVFKPVKAAITDAVLKIFEIDVATGEGKRARDDLIAEFKGKIEDKRFIVAESDCEELEQTESLTSPPSVALSFEGSDTRYKLVLNRGQENENEYSDWDLQIRVSGKTVKGVKCSFKTKHRTYIKGADVYYLENTASNRGAGIADPKADVKEGNNATHNGYCLSLKRHLTILGFYRIENENKFRWPAYSKSKKGVRLKWFDDKWNEELERALSHFHHAARQDKRLDPATNTFITVAPTFLSADQATRNEIDTIAAGDKTKEELITWLGADYYKVDGQNVVPKYRNPYAFCLYNAIDTITSSDYSSNVFTRYDPKSGRIINTRWEKDSGPVDKPGFVCVTAVNWMVGHIMLLGSRYRHSANASVTDAVMGVRRPSGVMSTPRYYNELFLSGQIEPAFPVPWMDERDAERWSEARKFLGYHKDVHLGERVPAKIFPVVRQNTDFTIADRTAFLRYIPQPFWNLRRRRRQFTATAAQLGITFQRQPATGPWSPGAWTPRQPLTVSLRMDGVHRRVRIVFDVSEDITALAGHRLLASYNAYDRFCDILGRHQNVDVNTPYQCKCGLHKCYSDIAANMDLLANWNIVTLSSTGAGHELSTLVIQKKVVAGSEELHAIHNAKYHPFATEAAGWHTPGANEVFYTVFKLEEDTDLARNHPTFYWEP